MAKKKDSISVDEKSDGDFFSSTIVNKIKKDYGLDVCVPLSNINDLERGVIKTFPSLDLNLGGGFLRGTLIQLAGKPKVGKSTLSFNIASKFQQQFPESHVIYYKCEGRMSKAVLDGIKLLDQNRFIVIKSTEEKILSAQEMLGIQENLMREFPGCLHILDSISGLSSDTELSGGVGDEQYCGNSKLLGKWCRRNASVYSITNSTIIALNHIRDNIRSMSGGSYTTGGKHWHHQLDTNIWLSDSYPNSKIENSSGTVIGM
jgi:recombination protein RecA